MKTIKVTYSNGDVVLNDMAAHLTDEQMLAYYAVGRQFNLGAGDKDYMATVVAAEVVKGVLHMTIQDIKSKNLINGAEYTFVTKNAADCIDVDQATIHYTDHLGKFAIWYNGQLLATYKHFQNAKQRFANLCLKERLEFNPDYQ